MENLRRYFSIFEARGGNFFFSFKIYILEKMEQANPKN